MIINKNLIKILLFLKVTYFQINSKETNFEGYLNYLPKGENWSDNYFKYYPKEKMVVESLKLLIKNELFK